MPPKFCSNPKFELSKGLKIGVIRGGSSSERAISLRSGRAIYRALKTAGLAVRYLDPADPVRLKKGLGKIDVAFLALHGHGGEDGVIQRQLERRRISYTGSDERGSRLAFNKVFAKRIFRRAGIPTADFVLLSPKNWKKKLVRFPMPSFVKPLCDGSSIGVFMVNSPLDSSSRIRRAFRRYGILFAEKRIQGREFTVGILGDRALPVVELKPGNAFYDYQAKYTKGKTDYLVPAPIPTGLARRLQNLGLRVHKALGLRDLSRVDIMVDGRGRPFVLEANTIPGFTEFSLLPKAARADGIGFEDLCCRLLAYACRRTRRPKQRGSDRG